MRIIWIFCNSLDHCDSPDHCDSSDHCIILLWIVMHPHSEKTDSALVSYQTLSTHRRRIWWIEYKVWTAWNFSDWSICIMRYSHPLFPTQTRESSYCQYSGTVCPVGTILASLSVRTTAGLFRVGGRDLGVLDASEESLALLFLLVVLVSEAEETAEVTCIRR